MSDYDAKMIMLSVENLDEALEFYTGTLGMTLKFRDGAHFAALDGGSVTIALATSVDHPIPGKVVVGIKTADDAARVGRDADGIAVGTAICNAVLGSLDNGKATPGTVGAVTTLVAGLAGGVKRAKAAA